MYNIRLDLVKFRVNETAYELGFVEPVLDEKYLNSHQNLSINKGFIDKSKVLNCTNLDSVSGVERFNALLDSINESSLSPLLKKKYSTLATAIVNNNEDLISKYFDLNEVSSFEALRKVLGLTGHGFERHNLLMFLDSVTNKVKLFTHRYFFNSSNNKTPFESFEQELIHKETIYLNKVSLYKHLLLENFIISDDLRLMS